MKLTKNRYYQLIFYTLISLIIFFNGGNYELFAQLNFILVSFFFIFCLKDKNYSAHIKKFFNLNKEILIIYFIFLLYLFIQLIPLPYEILKFFSPTKYNYLMNLGLNEKYSSISLDLNKSYFSFLNYFSLIIYLIIFKCIFYKERHFQRFYYFLTFIGFVSSAVAILLFLTNETSIFFFNKSNYLNSSTGFFINRTVFSCFLILSFLSGIEYLANIDQINKRENFYDKIYIRIYLLFITIGIITSFSRLGNFLLLILILIYLIKFYKDKDNQNKFIQFTLIAIIFFDLFIIGFFFGNVQLIDRFSFLKSDLLSYTNDNNLITSISRSNLAKFSLFQIKNFFIFGYGSGSFEMLFKNFYSNVNFSYADQAHFDLAQFIGEFGIIGIILVLTILLKTLKKLIIDTVKNIYLSILVILILFFDFSLHIPLIQLTVILIFSISNKKKIIQ